MQGIWKEFGERFKEEDLLALGNHQGILKLAIDGVTQSPFLAYTLPLPRSITQNREKVIKNSRMRYMKPVKKIEEKMPEPAPETESIEPKKPELKPQATQQNQPEKKSSPQQPKHNPAQTHSPAPQPQKKQTEAV